MAKNLVALKAEYDRIYDEADAIIKAHNPCGIQKADGKVSCNRSRRDPGWEHPKQVGQLCCSGCKHLGPEGCTVRSLGCKLGGCAAWGASYLEDTAGWPKDVAQQFIPLYKRAKDIGLSVGSSFRRSKDDFFGYMERVK